MYLFLAIFFLIWGLLYPKSSECYPCFAHAFWVTLGHEHVNVHRDVPSVRSKTVSR